MPDARRSAPILPLRRFGETLAACAIGAAAVFGAVTLLDQQSELDELVAIVAQMQQAQDRPPVSSDKTAPAPRQPEIVTRAAPSYLTELAAVQDPPSDPGQMSLAEIMAQTGIEFGPGDLCTSPTHETDPS